MRFKFNKRAALLVAVIILCIWSILGTGATVAWFTDTGEVVQNDFAVGTLEMEVEYRNETMLHYEPVTQTKGISQLKPAGPAPMMATFSGKKPFREGTTFLGM